MSFKATIVGVFFFAMYFTNFPRVCHIWWTVFVDPHNLGFNTLSYLFLLQQWSCRNLRPFDVELINPHAI